MKKDQRITVLEYVHTADGGLARPDQLGAKEYEKFRQWLACTWLNGLFRGQAEFYYPQTTEGSDGGEAASAAKDGILPPRSE